MNFNDLYLKFDDYQTAKRHSASYKALAKSVYTNHIAPHIGQIEVEKCTDQDVLVLMAALSSQSTSFANNVVNVFNTLLKSAKALGLKAQVTPLVSCKANSKLVQSLSPTEIDSILGACETTNDFLIVVLALDAGLRRSEILALRWEDVDFSRGKIFVKRSDWKGSDVPTKGKKERSVPLTGRLMSALCNKPRTKPSDRILRYNYNSLQCRVKTIFRRANLRQLSGLHVLRHTFGTRLAESGVSIHVIQQLMGHENIATTQRYLHATDKDLDNAIQKFEIVSEPRKVHREVQQHQQVQYSALPSFVGHASPTHPISEKWRTDSAPTRRVGITPTSGRSTNPPVL